MLNSKSDVFKRYLVSALVTFAAGFALVVTPELQTLSLESLEDGALFGLVIAGVRAGIKALFEMSLNIGSGQ